MPITVAVLAWLTGGSDRLTVTRWAGLAALTWTSALPSAKVLAAVAGLAVICTAVAFLLFFRLIAEVRPARASVITYINPAVAVAIGVSFSGSGSPRRCWEPSC